MKTDPLFLQVAIKELRKTADNQIILKKYLPKEASIVRRLTHPHILRTYHILETPNKVLYVMELAENGDLLDYVEARGHISEPEARFVFRQILEGIGYCHMADIAHRDIKCENIMLDRNMDVKIGGTYIYIYTLYRSVYVRVPCRNVIPEFTY